MTYKQIAAEFLYGCFQAALCLELLVCRLMRDTFGWVSGRFEVLCQDGMKQMARLRGEQPDVEPVRSVRLPVIWSRRDWAS